jgi:hypothetical protein
VPTSHRKLEIQYFPRIESQEAIHREIEGMIVTETEKVESNRYGSIQKLFRGY